jgi:hypothetical protein
VHHANKAIDEHVPIIDASVETINSEKKAIAIGHDYLQKFMRCFLLSVNAERG